MIANREDVAIVKAILSLGEGLDTNVVAEGVQSQALKEFLATLECQYMQGYYFSRPLPGKEMTTLLLSGAGKVGDKFNVFSGIGEEFS